jgi:hypothetical protein
MLNHIAPIGGRRTAAGALIDKPALGGLDAKRLLQ